MPDDALNNRFKPGMQQEKSKRMKTARTVTKYVFAALALSLITFLMLGTATSQATPEKASVTINAVFDFSTFPDVVGNFTASGALTTSGVATMDIGSNQNGTIAHCVVTLVDAVGTITIHQQCEFSTSLPKGQWEILGGTGGYADLKGNGVTLMPSHAEYMTGFIY